MDVLDNEAVVTSSPITIVSKSNLSDFSRYLKAYIDGMKSSVEDSVDKLSHDEIDIAWGEDKVEKVRRTVEFEDLAPAGDVAFLYDYDTTYSKGYIKSLEIAANDVSGRETSTVITYTAHYTSILNETGEELEDEDFVITGSVKSDEFGQNESETDTIERTIELTIDGATASTTITQGVYSNVVDVPYTATDEAFEALAEQWGLPPYICQQGWNISDNNPNPSRYVAYSANFENTDNLIMSGTSAEDSDMLYMLKCLDITGCDAFYCIVRMDASAAANPDSLNSIDFGVEISAYDFDYEYITYEDILGYFGEDVANKFFPEGYRDENSIMMVYLIYNDDDSSEQSPAYFLQELGVFDSNGESGVADELSGLSGVVVNMLLPLTLEQAYNDISVLMQ